MNQKSTSEFISRLSHEIRNPLTLINSSLQLLALECPSVTRSDLWFQIQEDLRSVLRLLNDVSVLNNHRKLHISNVNAASFLLAAASSFQSMAISRGIRFIVDLSSVDSPTIPNDDSIFTSDKTSNKDFPILMINCDEIKLREVLINLLMNAADAVVPDNPDPEIRFLAEHSKDHLHIHVKDNGPGIPEEYLSTLFDPFVTHKSNGTGLGLHIVKTITEWHHGTVTVTTSCIPGKSGTDFCISIPVLSTIPASEAFVQTVPQE